jgi:geranylgeranyl diphosphate synthase, type II
MMPHSKKPIQLGTVWEQPGVRRCKADRASLASEFAEGIMLVAEEYFQQAFAAAQRGPDLEFLRALVP